MTMKWLVAAGLLAGLTSAAEAQKVALVELFTSEGCSSCPPADALLRKIDGMKLGADTLVVGLSEHVTYWNSLGWADPYSQEVFTARQHGYGERFRLDSVYTPQMVVNGERQVLGSDERALGKAVTVAADGGAVISIRSASSAGGVVQVAYSVTGAPAGAEVWAVVADDLATSRVARGENGGRTLTHVSVARTMVKLGSAGGGDKTAEVKSPVGAGGQHLVIFVQAAGLGKVLGVARAKL